MTDEELLREALAVLEDTRCKLTDPTLRGRWAARKVALMRRLRERLGE